MKPSEFSVKDLHSKTHEKKYTEIERQNIHFYFLTYHWNSCEVQRGNYHTIETARYILIE